MKKISMLTLLFISCLSFNSFAQTTDKDFTQSAEYKCLTSEFEKLKPDMMKQCKLTEEQMNSSDINVLSEDQKNCVQTFSPKMEEIIKKCQSK